jgi:hypothetical protein
MRSLRQLAASGLSNLPDNPTRGTTLVVGLVKSIVGLPTRTRRQQTPYLCRILRISSGSSGIVRRYGRGYPRESGRRGQGDGALEALKAWGEVRTGRTPHPSDVAEERRRPCRARWGHDLSMGRRLEKLGPALYSPDCVEPTCFTHLLPRGYACLTPSYGGGCTLSMDHEIVGTIAEPRPFLLPLFTVVPEREILRSSSNLHLAEVPRRGCLWVAAHATSLYHFLYNFNRENDKEC